MSEEVEDRFWKSVDRRSAEKCWRWRGSLNGAGYGAFSLMGRTIGAHRVAWCLENGRNPSDLESEEWILHSCDNPACVNPGHLRLGTPKENSLDRSARGRSNVGSRNGHSKLTEKQVSHIRRIAGDRAGLCEAMKLYGVSQTTIWEIMERRTWKHVS